MVTDVQIACLFAVTRKRLPENISWLFQVAFYGYSVETSKRPLKRRLGFQKAQPLRARISRLPPCSQHEQLYRFMRHHRNGGFREIGLALKAAAALRVRADYHLDEDLPFAEADGHLASCRHHLEKVEQYIQRFSEPSEE